MRKLGGMGGSDLFVVLTCVHTFVVYLPQQYTLTPVVVYLHCLLLALQ